MIGIFATMTGALDDGAGPELMCMGCEVAACGWSLMVRLQSSGMGAQAHVGSSNLSVAAAR
jgi:hypothetical protein